MRALWTGFLLLVSSVSAAATPLTQGDIAALRAMSDGFVKGWMDNVRQAVMSSFSKDAVFIPHDGVRPKVGYAEIGQFWFPHGKASGVIPAFTHAISDISGADDHAVIYGRSDLTLQDETERYHWIGNFLFVAHKDKGRWIFTHLMSSDEQPKVEPLKKD